mgnify:CR=1 FL=1
MKKNEKRLFRYVLSLMMLLAGVQGAWALTCSAFSEGTVYLKLPTGWTKAYAVAQGNQNAFTASKKYPGWYEISTAMIGGTNAASATSFYISDAAANDCSNGHKCIMADIMGTNFQADKQVLFTCNKFDKSTGELWISEDPTGKNPSVPYVNTKAPNSKRFYVLLPNDESWKSSVPMYSPDGTFASGKAMSVDNDMCGWYYVQWLDETLPSSLVIFKDTDKELDDAIGVDGWNADVLTPFDIATYFAIYANDDGTEKDKLFFVPDQNLWDDLGESTKGIYDTDPGFADPSLCSYNLAALIYDTDASLHGAFTCDAYPMVASNGCYSASAKYNYAGNGQANTVPCIGVTPGMVEKTLSHVDKTDPYYKKPKYVASSGCFASTEAFDVMFRETQGINVQHCRDVQFKLAKDGMWEYDSYNEPAGAFTPLNDLADSVKAGLCTGTCATAATTHPGLGNIRYGQTSNDNNADNCKTDMTGFNLMSDYVGTKGCITKLAQQTIGTVPTDWSMTNPKTGLPYIDSYPAQKGEFASGTNPDVYDGTSWGERIKSDNNQMFCFESHADFIYRPGMKFYFRGDDDIWVYIDNVLAVDLGGTHLAAPAAVDLDVFKGEHGAFVTGDRYDIDIFFCDRRTDMSNVRIKTNMYIQQTSGLKANVSSRGANGEDVYELEDTESGDGSCQAVAMGGAEKQVWIGDDIINKAHKNITYSIETLKGVVIADNLAVGGTYYNGGINLTSATHPVINKAALMTGGLPPGRYNLVIRVEGATGKPPKIKFSVSGNLEVLMGNGVALDTLGETCTSSTCPGISDPNYKFVSSAVAGNLIPIYVSAVMPTPNENGLYEMDVLTAGGQKYSLNAGSLTVYVKEINPTTGEEVFNSLPMGIERTVGATGVDTLYVSMPMSGMETAVQSYTVSIAGHTNGAVVRFYTPQIAFVDSLGNTVSGDPKSENSERLVGSFYTFNLMALQPNDDGTSWSTCEDCNFDFHLGSKTPGDILVQNGSVMHFENGLASISIRATKPHRYDADPSKDDPAVLHVAGDNEKLTYAIYTPLYFREPPVPYPVLTDIFDVKGKKPEGAYNIYSDYFDENQEYLDGIADSLTIYYHRAFHVDSLPDSIFVKWDTEACTDKGNVSWDECDSVFIGKQQIKDAAICDITDEKGETRCQPYLGFGGLALSKDVKTVGAGIVSSWASYVDKGESMTKSFPSDITDRIAPVILSARSQADNDDGTIDKVTIVLSEPVQLIDGTVANEPFSYYLNSATTLKDGPERYRNSNSPTKPQDKKDTLSLRYNNTSASNPTPHVGDFIRFRADALIWSDTVKYNDAGKDTIRVGEDKHWNSPTDYASTDRLPSPWTPVVGESKIDVTTIRFTESNPESVPANTPVVSIYTIPTTKDLDFVKSSYPYTLGHFVQSDMGAIINSKQEYVDPSSPDHVDYHNVFFHYTVDYFTNLGGVVAHQTGTIYCDDQKNMQENGQNFFDGSDCIKNPKNFYVAWNLLSDKGRMVASGAYITKFESYVKLDNQGKTAKKSKTEVWGVRRGHGRIK